MLKNTLALQHGLQIKINFAVNTASFLRVFEHNGKYQTALVLPNKGSADTTLEVMRFSSQGIWRNTLIGEDVSVNNGKSLLSDVSAQTLKCACMKIQQPAWTY